MNIWLITGVLIYVVAILAISYFNKTKGISTYGYLGKREYTTFGLATSIASSWIGINTILLFGAFLAGFGYWVAIGLILPMIVLAFLPKLINKYFMLFKEKNFTTILDFVKYKTNKRVALLFALVLLVIHLVGMVNGYLAGAKVLQTIIGTPLFLGIIFLAIFVTLYILIGGFKAVIATDKIQYLAMIGIVIIAAIGLFSVDWSAISLSATLFKEVPIVGILFFIIYGLCAIFPENAFWQRMYAAKNKKVLEKGFFWGAVLAIIPVILLTLISIVGLGHAQDPALSIILFFQQQFGGILGILSILFFLAVMMSTMDTIFFSISTIILNDIFEITSSITWEKIVFILVSCVAIIAAWFSPDILNNAIIGVGIYMLLPIPIIYMIITQKISKLTLWSSILFGIGGIVFCVITENTGLILTPIVVGATLVGLGFGISLLQLVKQRY